MTFEAVCHKCISNKSLVKEFNRLTGSRLGEPRSGLEQMIDNACGYDPDKDAIPEFVRFVYEVIWLPLVVREVKE